MPIKEKIEKIKIVLANWRVKLTRKRIIISLIAILILLFFLTNIKKLQEERKVIPPSPSPTPAEEIITPSNYATDSAILAIEENIKTLEENLLETDLYETGLNPPVLDMEVEFKE